jgi:hypothetical protein
MLQVADAMPLDKNDLAHRLRLDLAHGPAGAEPADAA